MFSSKIPTASGIYRITCTVTGKFYIGSAVNLRIRWKDHRSDLRSGIHGNAKLQNAWNKYGEESFIFEILELVLVPEMLTAREQYYLDKLKPFDRDKGFNIAKIAGSSLGVKRSPETIEKLRLAGTGKKHSEETRQRLRDINLGRKHSPETIEKFRNARLGHSVSENTRAKLIERNAKRVKTLIATDPNGVEYVVVGIYKFCSEHHLSPTHLVNVAKGKSVHHKGWKARYPEPNIS